MLSPVVAFPALWLAGAALSQFRLLDVQAPWSDTAWLVVAFVPVAFVLGGVIGRELARLLPRSGEATSPATRGPGPDDRPGNRAPDRPPAPSRAPRALLLLCLLVGYAELAHQFTAAGFVPLLSSNIDEARFDLPGGPTIVLTNLLTVAAMVALSVPRRLLSREARFELIIAGGAIAGFALQGSRGSIVVPLAGAALVRALYWGPPRPRVLLGAAAALLSVTIALYYLRAAQHAQGSFEAELFAEVLPDTPLPLRPLLPVYISIVTNFEALARIVDFFPAVLPFGDGAYNALGYDLFITSAKDIGAVSLQLTPPFTTNTVAGPLWADGGMALVVLGVAAVGAISQAAFSYARATGEFRHALVAGYLLYLALFGIYTSLWTQHPDWLIVTPLLLFAGALATDPVRPPGLAGLALRGRRPARSAR